MEVIVSFYGGCSQLPVKPMVIKGWADPRNVLYNVYIIDTVTMFY